MWQKSFLFLLFLSENCEQVWRTLGEVECILHFYCQYTTGFVSRTEFNMQLLCTFLHLLSKRQMYSMDVRRSLIVVYYFREKNYLFHFDILTYNGMYVFCLYSVRWGETDDILCKKIFKIFIRFYGHVNDFCSVICHKWP